MTHETARTAALPVIFTHGIGSLPTHLALGMGVVDVRGERCNRSTRSWRWSGAGIVGRERIALNPDCGFAPDAGEPPTIDEAYEKLRRLVAAAQ